MGRQVRYSAENYTGRVQKRSEEGEEKLVAVLQGRVDYIAQDAHKPVAPYRMNEQGNKAQRDEPRNPHALFPTNWAATESFKEFSPDMPGPQVREDTGHPPTISVAELAPTRREKSLFSYGRPIRPGAEEGINR